jgi:hypothetical protein
MPPWYERPRSARVQWSAADGPMVCGAHTTGYGVDGGAHGPRETSRSVRAWAHGEGARLGRHMGADAKATGAQARHAARGAHDIAARCRPGLNYFRLLDFEHDFLQNFLLKCTKR